MPTASITESAPRPEVKSCTIVGVIGTQSMTSAQYSRARVSRSSTRSTPITRQSPRCDAIRQAIDPIGPSPSTTSVPPLGTSAYSTACHAVGSTSDR